MPLRSNLTAFTLAAAAATAPAAAHSPTFSPETERALQHCTASAQVNSRMPVENYPLIEQVVRGIGSVYESEGAHFNPGTVRSLCMHFSFSLDDVQKRVADGYCYAPVLGSSTPDRHGIRFRFCPDEGGTPVFTGAWRVTDREHAREQLTQELRDLLQAVSVLEHGTKIDSRETWHTLLNMFEREQMETRLDNGACATNRLTVTGHDYDVTVCKAQDKLTAGRGAVRPAP